MNVAAPQSQRFKDRVVVVTGAGSGMGRSHALAFAAEGARVVVQDVVGESAERTAQLIREQGARTLCWVGDIADVPDVERRMHEVVTRLGPVGVLVNNAGFVGPGRTSDIEESEFDRMFDVHVKGAFFATRASLGSMRENGGGAIINISSTAGLVGHHHFPHYCAAKAALLGLTKAWAKELAEDKIRVNAVAPGGVKTPMSIAEYGGEENLDRRAAAIPLGFYGQPMDVTPLVLFLASEEARYITGQVVSPNGGEVVY